MTPDWLRKWEPGLYDKVKTAASRHGIEPEWVAAVVQVESAGNPNAVRFEQNWKYFYNVALHAKRLKITNDSEKTLQQFSWGLMQVMGSVAREWGFPDSLFELCSPMRGLEYGCRHLKNMRRRFPTGRDWIAAYNAGTPRKRPDGSYENEEYVRKVVGYWSDLTDS
jgi:soluble lytic murein transglycosylase-like protein